MKKINKQISTVALTGMVVAGGVSLSHGLTGTLGPDFIPKTLLTANILNEYPQGGAYTAVEKHQYDSGYNAIYLGYNAKFNKFIKTFENKSGHRFIIPKNADIGGKKEVIPSYYGLKPNYRYYYLEFEDGADFSTNINRLDKYKNKRNKLEPIVVKLEGHYFCIFFDTTYHDRNVMPVKQLGESYGFTVIDAQPNTVHGLSSLESTITKLLKNPNRKDKAQIKALSKYPNEKNTFLDAEDFGYDLKNKIFNVPKGLSRCRIGDYDYILEVK